MDRSLLPRELRPFLDDDGRLRQWPARQKVQRMAVAWLARRFEPGRGYDEKQVNFLLMDGHSFADWALLRRSLVDWGFMTRAGDGTDYRLVPDSDTRIARELGTADAGR
jgi:hypothetical protein